MDELAFEELEQLFAALGQHLNAAGGSAAIVVVGGSTLAYRGWVDRTTKDVDVIAQATVSPSGKSLCSADPLPKALVDAVKRVARDFGLSEDWLNTAIGAQWDFGLPAGFAEEIEWREFGPLTVGFAGRQSIIALKLFAAVDQGPESVHLQDLIALEPRSSELERAVAWVLSQDQAEAFPALVEEVKEYVRRALG
ncbi:MAG: hypothetical protein PVJ76_17865 [Gemmatimonadota bacterium]